MIKDPQEYLQEWEKQNNPFYPNEMRWDRIKVNTFLKDWKQQLTLTDVVKQSEQFNCYEMHAYSRFAGCNEQCKECLENEKSKAI